MNIVKAVLNSKSRKPLVGITNANHECQHVDVGVCRNCHCPRLVPEQTPTAVRIFRDRTDRTDGSTPRAKPQGPNNIERLDPFYKGLLRANGCRFDNRYQN